LIVSLLLFTLTWRDFGLRKSKTFLKRFFIENRAFAWAVVPATFLIYHTSAGFAKASVVHIKPWWSLADDASAEAVISWFWKNFGVAALALVCVFTFLTLVKRILPKDNLVHVEVRSSWDEVLILFLFFFLFMFVMLAPWEWDNIKILVWPWVLIFAALGRSVIRMSGLRPSYFWPILTWIGIATAFGPGASLIAQSWSKPQEKSLTVWTIEQLAYGESVLKRVSKKAVFAAATTPNHVLTYFGRVRALGYQGHLWSHAIDFAKAERELEILMNGTEGWVEAAKALKVSHIYWGPEERLRWGSGPRVWQTRLPLVAKAGEHEVYEFKETR
jgi:hypothetical protein